MKRFAVIAVGLTLQSIAGQGAAQTAAADAMAAARRGGVVIACRHGITDSFDENELTLDYANPATQRRLTAAGEQQSVELGQAFRALGIRAAEIIASPMQRAQRMAELMFETVTIDSLWHTRGNSYSGPKLERRREVLSAPVRDGNRIIISHIGTLQSVLPDRNALEEGDCLVIRPEGRSFTVIGRVPWRAWIEAAARTRDLP